MCATIISRWRGYRDATKTRMVQPTTKTCRHPCGVSVQMHEWPCISWLEWSAGQTNETFMPLQLHGLPRPSWDQDVCTEKLFVLYPKPVEQITWTHNPVCQFGRLQRKCPWLLTLLSFPTLSISLYSLLCTVLATCTPYHLFSSCSIFSLLLHT